MRAELQSLVDESLESIGVPSNMHASPGTIGIVAPVLAMFANDEQRRRHLRKVFTCEELWCQLFSEPSAGSDLPALRSSAVSDGDSWILNGHKVWTTMGHIAQFGLLLARTSDRPRHKGITCFILDMSSPGVEVRPLRQMTGDAEFNEVFFTDVVIPDQCRIGDVDDGWRIAIGTLMEERNAVNYVQDAEVPAVDARDRTVAFAASPTRGLPCAAIASPTSSCRPPCTRTCAHGLSPSSGRQRRGRKDRWRSCVAASSTRRCMRSCVELLGADGMLWDTYEMRQPASWYEFGVMPSDVRRAFLRSRANTIEGGTNEIQRNIIAERVLGLPREPKP